MVDRPDMLNATRDDYQAYLVSLHTVAKPFGGNERALSHAARISTMSNDEWLAHRQDLQSAIDRQSNPITAKTERVMSNISSRHFR